jgi:hypothetical protein
MKMRTATRAKRSTSGTQVPFGAIGLGALAVGAVAFGALVIRALAIKRGKIGRRDIEDGGVRMERDVREGMLKRDALPIVRSRPSAHSIPRPGDDQC